MQSERDKKGAGLADEDVETIHYWIYSPGDGRVNGMNFVSVE